MSRMAGPDGEGDSLRAEVLARLAREPLSGMELITAFAEEEENPRHIPPGTMYPLLDALTTEGLTRLSMTAAGSSRQRPFELTGLGWQQVNGTDGPPAESSGAGARAGAGAEGASVGEETSLIEVRTRETPPWDTNGSASATPLEEATERLWRAVDDARRNATDTQADRATELVEECARELHDLLVAEGVRRG